MPCRSGGRIFFSRVNFLCCCLFNIRFTPVLPLWHLKDPGHSARSVGGRLHLNTHTSLTQGQTMLSRYSLGTYQGNKLTCNSPGNTCPQLPKLIADWSWPKEWNWYMQDDTHFKKKGKCRRGLAGRTYLPPTHPNPRMRGITMQQHFCVCWSQFHRCMH